MTIATASVIGPGYIGLPRDRARAALAFKANIDDWRESPAVGIVKGLAESHPGRVPAEEPNVKYLPAKLGKVELVQNDDATATQVHVMLVDQREFKKLPTPEAIILDLRDVWRREPAIAQSAY